MPDLSNSSEFNGACHCGALEVRLEMPIPLSEIQVRACQCNFCTSRGSVGVSNANGKVEIRITKLEAVNTYRFGHGSADFVVCSICGTYVAATMGEGNDMLSVINPRGLAIKALADITPTNISFDAEAPGSRLERRRRNWTPTVIIHDHG